ncbi:M15 family metallopeptidase [Priestia flexa]|uniref:M15 family metallopeptidase n=1 Tax=Priestia flexa TaxID=86664 RepID=UPI000687E47C|nr:M15 family metallopeptidase [Priestia flexa]
MTMTYDSRNRKNLDQLHPNTKKAAYTLYEYALKNNINILIYETIRTIQQQQQNIKNKVSQTMKSYHIVGQALDFVPINEKGKAIWNGYNSPQIQGFIKYAKKLGFTWGGDWTTLVDSPHLQYNYKGYGTDVSLSKTPVKAVTPVKEMIDSIVPPIVKYEGILKVGSKGKNVQRVQRAVNVKPDGIYGHLTKEAVMKYQARKGLNADGIVGEKTWNMLF